MNTSKDKKSQILIFYYLKVGLLLKLVFSNLDLIFQL